MTNIENLPGEIWKEIPGYEGYYMASNIGRLKSLERMVDVVPGQTRVQYSRILKTRIHKNGYSNITLQSKKTLKTLAHRLIALAFIPNPDNKRCVNHINGVKTDNRAENLEWATHSENVAHARATGLQPEFCGQKPVLQTTLNGDVIRIWKSQTEARKIGGFNNECISLCCHGKQEQHKGYRWEFA